MSGVDEAVRVVAEYEWECSKLQQEMFREDCERDKADEPLLSTKQVAARTGYSEGWVRERRERRELRWCGSPSKPRHRWSDVLACLEARPFRHREGVPTVPIVRARRSAPDDDFKRMARELRAERRGAA